MTPIRLTPDPDLDRIIRCDLHRLVGTRPYKVFSSREQGVVGVPVHIIIMDPSRGKALGRAVVDPPLGQSHTNRVLATLSVLRLVEIRHFKEPNNEA